MTKLEKEIHFDEALEMFNDVKVATQVAKDLCTKYDIVYEESQGRKIRNWLNPTRAVSFNGDNEPKILIYDIETTLLLGEVWNAGKMNYMNASSLHGETEIITVAYKWLGDDEVHHIVWDNEKKNDKKLIKEFLGIYNSADAVVGVNNDRFDNKIVNARAAKYRFFVDTLIKSIDIQKQAKTIWRIPSVSMKYMAQYFGLTHKLEHAGIDMWRDIQWGSKKASSKALKAMVDYNIGDIITTEELYTLIQTYAKHKINLGVMKGGTKWGCPDTGSPKVKLHKRTVTMTGTVKIVMKSKETKRLYTISNREYLRFLKFNN